MHITRHHDRSRQHLWFARYDAGLRAGENPAGAAHRQAVVQPPREAAE